MSESSKNSLFKMSPLTPETSEQQTVFNSQVIPDELEIYYRNERYFLPEGKDFSDLTPEELKEVKNKYRFSPLRPGVYQGITGIASYNGRGSMI